MRTVLFGGFDRRRLERQNRVTKGHPGNLAILPFDGSHLNGKRSQWFAVNFDFLKKYY
jgi:hypothetical protein